MTGSWETCIAMVPSLWCFCLCEGGVALVPITGWGWGQLGVLALGLRFKGRKKEFLWSLLVITLSFRHDCLSLFP